MDGIASQNVQVKFSYFSGRIAWRPILVSLALLLLTNVAGAIMFGREMFGVVRTRRRARAAAGRYRARSNGQAHEVEIEIADGRVTEIERRVYRLTP